MNSIQIRRAGPKDDARIRELLRNAELPCEDITAHLNDFLVAEHIGSIVGTVGLEPYGDIALLRSLAVAASHRNKGVGRKLYDGVVSHARLKGVKRLYLLTTTAKRVFRHLGFDDIERNRLPDEIRSTDEFQRLCPDTAVCMTKGIDKDIYYVPRSIQSFVESVPGASMLAVPLEKAMLTYFEIAPGARFDTHKHESEQITYVIEGRLVFEIGDQSVSVGPGDIIAIPSNVPHAAFAGSEHVRAVDAWSPVRQEFIQKK